MFACPASTNGATLDRQPPSDKITCTRTPQDKCLFSDTTLLDFIRDSLSLQQLLELRKPRIQSETSQHLTALLEIFQQNPKRLF